MCIDNFLVHWQVYTHCSAVIYCANYGNTGQVSLCKRSTEICHNSYCVNYNELGLLPGLDKHYTTWQLAVDLSRLLAAWLGSLRSNAGAAASPPVTSVTPQYS